MIDPTKKFVGILNYAFLLLDSEFLRALLNTVYFTIVVVPASIIISLFFAVLLNNKIRGLSFYRLSFFLPMVTSINAIAMVWIWMYHPENGIINFVIAKLGFEPKKWLLSPNLAMPSVMIMSIWKNLGYNIIILLAGLTSIPKEYYDAGAIDGAGAFRSFYNITMPLLMPIIFFLSIVSMIYSFETFTQVFMLTPDGGPLGSTSTVVFYLYRNAFVFFKMGYASSIAVVLFFITFMFALIQHKVIGKKIHYGM
jgi:multiple sugar transport system permease protein